MFFEKKVWDDVGGYDENMKIGYEDWEFNIRLSKNGYYPSKIDEALFYYSVSSEGMLKSQSDKNYISGSAEEFCQVVTQVRNIKDVNLNVHGTDSNEWMSIAQCFAGPLEIPPAPGTRKIIIK